MPAYTVSGYAYVDSSGDGVRQAGEAGVAGATVAWTINRGAGNVVLLNMATDGTGRYAGTVTIADNPANVQLTLALPRGRKLVNDGDSPRAFVLSGLAPANAVDFACAAGKACYYPASSWVFKVCWVPAKGVQVTFKDHRGRPNFTCVYPATTYEDYLTFLAMASQGRWVHAFYWWKAYVPAALEV